MLYINKTIFNIKGKNAAKGIQEILQNREQNTCEKKLKNEARLLDLYTSWQKMFLEIYK